MDNLQLARRILYVLAATVAFLGVWYLMTPYYGPVDSNESGKTLDDFKRGTRAVCTPVFVPVSLSSEWPLVENCRKVGALRMERMWTLFAVAGALSVFTRIGLADPKPPGPPSPPRPPSARRQRIDAFLAEHEGQLS